MRTAEAMAAALALLCVAATRLQSPKGSETLPAAPKRLRIVKPLALPPLPSAPRVAPRLVVIPPGIKTNHLYFWWSDHTDYDKRHVFGIEAAARDDREQVGLNLGLHTGRDTGETFRCLQQIVWIT